MQEYNRNTYPFDSNFDRKSVTPVNNPSNVLENQFPRVQVIRQDIPFQEFEKFQEEEGQTSCTGFLPVIPVSALIKKVIYSDPCTIVLWNDGSKTVVRCDLRDAFDKEKGLAMAIVKRMCGNNGAYYEIFKEHAGEY